MAKGAGRKLKVFQTRIGFHDIVVAAASRAAALRAFGTRRDLFAQGLASEVTDPALVEAALAQPDTPLRRPAGSDVPFSVAPQRPTIAALGPEETASEDGAAPAPKKPTERPPPDRSKLDAAEARLAELTEAADEGKAELEEQLKALEEEERELRARRDAFDADAVAKRKAWRDQRAEAEETVARERRAYVKAGGKT